MRNLKAIAISAVLVAAMSGGAFALDKAGQANTADPNSAPNAQKQKTKAMTKTTGSSVKDTAATANTADPNSAPNSKAGQAKRGSSKTLDAAGRANTADPNSTRK